MPQLDDLTGRTFHSLTVLARADNAKNGGARWSCVCECGAQTTVRGSDLKTGNTKSCGCRKLKLGAANQNFRHGQSRTPTYASWCSAVQRCTNPKNRKWRQYGGRGITVCERWRDYEAFLADMGERPAGTTLDRIDTNGHYEPGNCRWATQRQQQNNRRNNTHYEFQGKHYSLRELAAVVGMSLPALRSRLFRGMTVTEAVSIPLREASLKNVNSSKTKTAG